MEKIQPLIKMYDQGTKKQKTLSESANSIFSSAMLCEWSCRVWLVNELFNAKKIRCSGCNELVPAETLEKYVICEKPPPKFFCPSCQKWFLFWPCTPFKGLHLKPQDIFMLVLLSAQKDSIKNMAIRTGRDRGCLPGWLKRIEKAFDNE